MNKLLSLLRAGNHIEDDFGAYGYSSYDYDAAAAEVSQILGIMVIVWFGCMLFALLNYILFSLGLYRVAKNHDVESPGLAWIPVARQWVKGSIVDFHANQKGYDSKWRILLPIFACIPFVVIIVLYVVLIAAVLSIESNTLVTGVEETIIAAVLTLLVSYVILLVFMLLNSISNIICDYKIYEEVVPKRAVLYTFLSYLLPLAHGICLLSCNKYGNGIKQEPARFDSHESNYGYQAAPAAQPKQDDPVWDEPAAQPKQDDPVWDEPAAQPKQDDFVSTEPAVQPEPQEAANPEPIETPESVDDSDAFTE